MVRLPPLAGHPQLSTCTVEVLKMFAVVYRISDLAGELVIDLAAYVGGVIAPAVGAVLGVALLVRLVRKLTTDPFDEWERTPGRYSAEGRRQAGLD
jgi:hypothetical protein